MGEEQYNLTLRLMRGRTGANWGERNEMKHGGTYPERRLTQKEVLSIPSLLSKHLIYDIAKKMSVSYQAIWYHKKKLQSLGYKVATVGWKGRNKKTRT